jgi:hypothetical protein
MHGYRVFLQISFEVVAVFAKHHQEDTGIPNHFALPGVHGHDSNKRHRICNGTLALGCGYCGGLYSIAAMADMVEDKDTAQYLLSKIQPS